MVHSPQEAILPPRPGHRLDLFLVPDDRAPLPDGSVLDEVVAGSHPPPATLVEGGFRGLRVDRPGRVVLYCNRMGGFRVACPQTGASIVPDFTRAVAAWRDGGPLVLGGCASCGGEHHLDVLDYQPQAAFGVGAVVLVEVASGQLTEAGAAWARGLLGGFRVVGSRR